MRIELGDVVRVIAPYPNGCSVYTFGDVGVVTEIDEGFYRVKSRLNSYLYDASQITLAKPYDIADAFRDVLGIRDFNPSDVA